MSAPAAPRRRLDTLLVERGLAATTQQAQALIGAGLVEVDGVRAGSAADKVTAAQDVRVAGPDHPWASRAGLKLVAALDAFGVECTGRIALDAGASTGGFTSVLLARGVSRVYAVDVGHGQLLPSVAADERVTVMDRTNLRTLTSLPGPAPGLVTLDLSFISIRAVVPALERIATGAEVVALFKPQFEVARRDVGSGGVVRDTALAETAATELLAWINARGGAVLSPPQPAAVRGAKGNQEWMLHFRLGADGGPA